MEVAFRFRALLHTLECFVFCFCLFVCLFLFSFSSFFKLFYLVFKHVDIYTYTRHTHKCKVNICRLCNGVQQQKQTKTKQKQTNKRKNQTAQTEQNQKNVRAKICEQSYKRTFTTTTATTQKEGQNKNKRGTTTAVMTTYKKGKTNATRVLGVGKWGLGPVELWVGSNIIKLFSFTYIAASRTAHVHYFSCVYTLSFVIYVLLS